MAGENVEQNARSTIDLSARRNAQMGKYGREYKNKQILK